jgi:MYXO-CTERM domain-containing protein
LIFISIEIAELRRSDAFLVRGDESRGMVPGRPRKNFTRKEGLMHTSISRKLLTLALVVAPFATQAAVVADSAADFSGTQGQGGWYYGYYQGSFNPGSFYLMNQYDANSSTWYIQSNNYNTLLNSVGGIPNGAISNSKVKLEQWAVRRWVSDVEGQITLRAVIGEPWFAASIDNGLTARIYMDKTQLASFNTAEPGVLGPNGVVEPPYTATLSVSRGTILDFAIDPNYSRNFFDYASFKVTISDNPVAVPEPGSASLALVGLLGLAMPAIRRRRSQNGHA